MAAISPSMLVDMNRLEQVMFIARARGLFRESEVANDVDGIPWLVKHYRKHWYAICGLGPGWMFDPHARERKAAELASAQNEIRCSDATQISARLNRTVSHTRFGLLTERVFWYIHRRVLESKQSTVMLPDFVVAQHLWGSPEIRLPKHWRRNIMGALRSLSQLHLSTSEQDDVPAFGTMTSLVTHAADLRRSRNDHCPPDCPAHGGPAHSHFFVSVGRGFLGILERCADVDDEAGTRNYDFPTKGNNNTGPTLRQLGSTGTLMSMFLPARLGEPEKCGSLTHDQHRLFQAILRERGRRPRKGRREFSEPELLDGNDVPNAQGREKIECPHLGSHGRYFGFNGNGKRRGCGYQILSEGGWLFKAGYDCQDVENFLADLAALSRQLRLVISGIVPGTNPPEWLDLARMRQIARQRRSISLLRRLHLRIYAESDYEEQWNRSFGWPFPSPIRSSQADDDVRHLNGVIEGHGITATQLATAIGMDPSQLSKIRNGKRSCPNGLLNRVLDWIRDDDKETVPQPAETVVAQPRPEMTVITPVDHFPDALDYWNRGWSVIPQVPGTKQPYVKWRPFQGRQPVECELQEWWDKWPDAGIALIAGELSKVLVIDVDGTDAHEELLKRLGSEPAAPKVISGSHEPNRYHLFFQHPSFPTKAKKTPWHPKLEFRGNAGLAILPPSLHKSGNRYAWANGRSLNDLPLPALPSAIVEALQPQLTPPPQATVSSVRIVTTDASASTLDFLRGLYADGPSWNDRLYNAACDLAGRGVPFNEAEPSLIGGARPWDDGEMESAKRTILSAYSQPRVPGER